MQHRRPRRSPRATPPPLCASTASLAAIIIWHTRHRWIKVVAVVACAAVPLTIAGSRVYRGMHYPTDVLAGGLLGAIWLTVVIVYVRTHDAGGRRDAAVDADRGRGDPMMRAAIIVNPATADVPALRESMEEDADGRGLVNAHVAGDHA